VQIHRVRTSAARRFAGTAALAALVLSLATVPAIAGAPASERRYEELPRICRQGPNADDVCSSDADCAGARCAIDVLPGKLLIAKVTLVVDDDVSRFDGGESIPSVVAATALVEFFQGGRKRLLAQTYENLSGDTLAELVANLQDGPELADTGLSGRRVTEAQVADAVATEGIFDDLLFQKGDSELADEVRGLFRTTAEPVVVRVASKAPKFQYEDRSADGLASVLSTEVSIRFVGR
jgi:hypothetical protein